MKHLILVLIVFSMSACTALGKSDFSCNKTGTGAGCTSARDVYQLSNGGADPAVEIRKTQAASNNVSEKTSRDDFPKGHSSKNGKGNSDPVIDTFVTPNLDQTVPIRTPSVVMRIWVSSWEDSGVLISPGYLYSEVEARRWVIGKSEAAADAESRVYRPLEDSSKHTP
ncbi:MAG: type IV conjugative transfer system protein TraV [Gammaproteobacteria bacterium]|nr:MAG: type IV conjugative transfer system protein TraV [Gammaproteobacteria bacterium]